MATYRLLLVSSFRRPVVIQLEVRANGTGLLTAKMTSGIHGELGPVLRDESVFPVREQVDEFLESGRESELLDDGGRKYDEKAGWVGVDFGRTKQGCLSRGGPVVAAEGRGVF